MNGSVDNNTSVSAKMALLAWVNAETNESNFGSVNNLKDLIAGDHLFEIAFKNFSSNFKHENENGDWTAGEKFLSVWNFLSKYYEPDLINGVDIRKALEGGDEFEIAKVTLLLLNVVLTKNPVGSHISLCDKLPQPVPAQILEFVRSLVGRVNLQVDVNDNDDGGGDQIAMANVEIDVGSTSYDYFQALRVNLCKTEYSRRMGDSEPRLDDVAKKLRFDDQSTASEDMCTGNDLFEPSTISSSCNMNSAASSASSAPDFVNKRRQSLDATLIAAPLLSPFVIPPSSANRNTFSNNKSFCASDNSSPRSSRSPLARISQSALVQFKRQIREKDQELRHLKEIVNEKNYELDGFKVEMAELNRKLNDQNQELSQLIKRTNDARNLEMKLQQEKFDKETLEVELSEKVKEIEKLRQATILIETMKSDLKESQSEKIELEKENAELNRQLEIGQKSISSLKQQLTELTANFFEKEKYYKQEIDQLKLQNYNQQSDIVRYRDQCDQLQYLAEESKHNKRTIEQLQIEVSKKDENFFEMERTLNTEREQFRDSITALTTETKNLNSKIDELISKVKYLEVKASEESDLAEQTFRELQNCRSENSALKENMKCLFDELTSKRALIEQLSDDLKQSSCEKSKLVDELEHLKPLMDEKQKLRDQIEQLNAEKSQLERDALRRNRENYHHQQQHNTDVTFQSFHSAELFFRRDFCCENENEPEIMVQNSITTCDPSPDCRPPQQQQAPNNNNTDNGETQVVICTRENERFHHLGSAVNRPPSQFFKRPATPVSKLTFDSNSSLDSINNTGAQTSTPSDWSRRLTILHDRNQHVPPHLKCSYPVEIQSLAVDVKEDDLKYSSAYQIPVSVQQMKIKPPSKPAAGQSSLTQKPQLNAFTKETLQQNNRSSKLQVISKTPKWKKLLTKSKQKQQAKDKSPLERLVSENMKMTTNSLSYSIANSAYKQRKTASTTSVSSATANSNSLRSLPGTNHVSSSVSAITLEKK